MNLHGKIKIDAQDRQTLKLFMKAHIPNAYKDLDSLQSRGGSSFDPMYCYEEVFDYADGLFRGLPVDSSMNFVGSTSEALTDDFRGALDSLKAKNVELADFCDVLTTTIEALKKYRV